MNYSDAELEQLFNKQYGQQTQNTQAQQGGGMGALGNIGGNSGSTSEIGNMGTRASQGATVAGPWGAVVGAAVGLLETYSNKQRAKKELKAKKRAALGQQEQNYQRSKNNVLSGVIGNYGTY